MTDNEYYKKIWYLDIGLRYEKNLLYTNIDIGK